MKHTVYHKKLILYFFYHINSIQNGIIMTSHQCQGYKEKTCKKSKRYLNKRRSSKQIGEPTEESNILLRRTAVPRQGKARQGKANGLFQKTPLHGYMKL